VEDLVQAMVDVWRVHPDARLVMMGGDVSHGGASMAARLRELAGDQGDRLHLLGHQPAERLFPALAAADVVALPSRWEPFGIAALEVMALGRPTILTSGSGFDEFAAPERDALMVRPADPAALGDAIVRLLGDPELRRSLGAEAAQTAERYDAPIVAGQHAHYFEQVADG
jgi:glycogen synthase